MPLSSLLKKANLLLFLRTIGLYPNSHFYQNFLEKVVADQLTAALERNNIYTNFKTPFGYSTKTALLRVSDILMLLDAGNCSLLVLLC